MSIKIIIYKDNKPIDQARYTGDEITIGRKSECDVSIKDPAVSGNHARIQKVGHNYLIQDLKSTNGVVIKGRRVKQQVLQPEDVITIGQHKLKVRFDKAESTTTGAEASPAAAPASGGFLEVLSGKQAGTQIPLQEALTTIGEPGIQVAAVSKRPQGYFIIHVDGGKDRERVPLVNGEPTGFKSRKLEPGDKIEVAGIQMAFHDE